MGNLLEDYQEIEPTKIIRHPGNGKKERSELIETHYDYIQDHAPKDVNISQ